MSSKKEIAARHEHYEKLLTAAHTAAAVAQVGMVENPRAFDCGFAWVIVEDQPGFMSFCRRRLKELEPKLAAAREAYRAASTTEEKEAADVALRTVSEQISRYGRKGTYRGWQFWKPGSFPGQSISIHEAGANAFRDVLAQGTITINGLGSGISSGSRLD